MAFRETRDFVDANGNNVISEWLDGFPEDRRASVKGKLDNRLHYIRSAPRIRDDWMEKLEGEDDGIYEIKVSIGNVEHRILACYGPGAGQITMLFPAREQNDRLRPAGARRTARERAAMIADDPERTVLHDY